MIIVLICIGFCMAVLLYLGVIPNASGIAIAGWIFAPLLVYIVDKYKKYSEDKKACTRELSKIKDEINRSNDVDCSDILRKLLSLFDTYSSLKKKKEDFFLNWLKFSWLDTNASLTNFWTPDKKRELIQDMERLNL